MNWRRIGQVFIAALLGFMISNAFHRIAYVFFRNDPVHQEYFSLAMTVILMLSAIGYVLFLISKDKKLSISNVERMIQRQKGLFSPEEVPDIFAVNAALAQLVETSGTDEEAILAVLKFASKIRPTNPWFAKTKKKNKPRFGSPGEIVTGHTQEFGNVETVDSRSSAGSGIEQDEDKTRVGQFKLWRSLDMVFFQPFWCASQQTATDPFGPYSGWAILFMPDSFVSMGFGQIGTVEPESGGSRVMLVCYILTGPFEGKLLPLGMFR